MVADNDGFLIGVAGGSTHDIRNIQRIAQGEERSVRALL
jgi:hypothetical protein